VLEKTLEQAREKLGLKHYSIRTEHSCLSWIKRYILLHHKRNPKEMGAHEIEEFFTHLAVKMKLPAAPLSRDFRKAPTSCRVSRGNNPFISPHPNPLPKERELKGNPVASYRE